MITKLTEENIKLVQEGDLIYFKFCEIYEENGWFSGVYLVTEVMKECYTFSFDRRLFRELNSNIVYIHHLLMLEESIGSIYLINSKETT
jgi:hypothetical protein